MSDNNLSTSDGAFAAHGVPSSDIVSPCDRCEDGNLLGNCRFEGIEDARTDKPTTIHYRCPKCGGHHEAHIMG